MTIGEKHRKSVLPKLGYRLTVTEVNGTLHTENFKDAVSAAAVFDMAKECSTTQLAEMHIHDEADNWIACISRYYRVGQGSGD